MKMNAKFISSYDDYQKCPEITKPEYAFIGRSNVGKSSLINSLTGVKNLAMTSSKPGKTQLINLFTIEETWILADLPGYGFAKASQSSRIKWGRMVHDYLKNRTNLTTVFLLVDSRHEPMKSDLEQITWLASNGIPFSLIFTKIDKQSLTQTNKILASWTKVLSENWEELPKMFLTSSESGKGTEELLTYIDEINKQIAN
ncbi:ribosome biogenesis GTP-binding protein YihA/YsxC [Cytophaga hutchinsonii]|jgi:GTP-binding protein|uniref:Probable GTP-binding protein EngB n=1 Tax=Cytophaga hutchinsonii (strain ATCC 33406 / DSM 1761 / CIP 103989 / NBRC 15051 / NCIMB 9469 / D465) TaxID=269798 RepID=ENGB_CYTH3|nr:ribosome biogenesis GTP-binding protein YihA/YsxC [Cytophaga hutchinsonii]Q11RJ8.1 RecName: Full=Probable GTP-binding protein EngB [Cytophaga hutchinsonii ATCC 33406]ABG59966.1 GTP-binding protein [Cytophaga hutchinsonii ATCC 33406]SFX26574.1 GTP-binding protein [Cytophaga hutchinsonii ATCC 33406]